MGQFSVEKPVAPGSALSGNQQGHVLLMLVERFGEHMPARSPNFRTISISWVQSYNEERLTTSDKHTRPLPDADRQIKYQLRQDTNVELRKTPLDQSSAARNGLLLIAIGSCVRIAGVIWQATK